MSGPGKETGGWTQWRFLVVAGVLFVLQVALILAFGDRAGRAVAAGEPGIRFSALDATVTEEKLWSVCLAGDPAVFAWPGVRGFSGRGWLSQRPPSYTPTNRLEAPVWLDLNLANLGNIPAAVTSSPTLLPLALEDRGSMSLEPLPIYLPAEVVQTNSIFRLEGAVARRWTGAEPALAAWPNAQLLSNSVVEIAVNRVGDIVAHRLVVRSGSPKADAAALIAAKGLRFERSASGMTDWGRAVFEWRTSEETNAAGLK